MAQRFIDEHLDHLPLFPLPGALLFPTMTMPLHIFEPRYRQMVSDAQRDGLPIAIGHIIESEERRESRPAVYPVMGAGFIEQLQKLPDGRYLLELKGHARVRIVEEINSASPYRIVRAELLPDEIVVPSDAVKAINDLRRVVLAIGGPAPNVASAISQAIADRQTPGQIADAVAAMVHTSPDIRQGWLDEANPLRRLAAVTEALETFLAQTKLPSKYVN